MKGNKLPPLDKSNNNLNDLDDLDDFLGNIGPKTSNQTNKARVAPTGIND